ncbi:MAG: hypothetical protein M1410_03605 [Candidatus Thermoplasmatota archaeon]|nr:hypothetical protein [Candidatus Thermoplasmatota archaeon]
MWTRGIPTEDLTERKPTNFSRGSSEDAEIRTAEAISTGVPQGMRDLKPDKLPERDSGRWSKTLGLNEGGTVGEAGTPHVSAVGGMSAVALSHHSESTTVNQAGTSLPPE